MGFDLDALPTILASHIHDPAVDHRYRYHPRVFIVHTAESSEGPAVARAVARYCARAEVDAGYKVIVDDTEAIRNCWEGWWDNGAGGAWPWGWNLCITGSALQTLEQWDDPFSRMAITNAAAIAKQVLPRYAIPAVKVGPDALRGLGPDGPGVGICGHADVSAVYPASQGHTDPGGAFPWDTFLSMLGQPSQADVVAFFKLLAELLEVLDVEHGMAVDIAVEENPHDPTKPRMYVLDRWGGITPKNGAKPVPPKGEPGGLDAYWQGDDVARRIKVVDWEKPAGIVMDLNGGLHTFGGLPAPTPKDAAYWGGGKIVPIAEL